MPFKTFGMGTFAYVISVAVRTWRDLNKVPALKLMAISIGIFSCIMLCTSAFLLRGGGVGKKRDSMKSIVIKAGDMKSHLPKT